MWEPMKPAHPVTTYVAGRWPAAGWGPSFGADHLGMTCTGLTFPIASPWADRKARVRGFDLTDDRNLFGRKDRNWRQTARFELPRPDERSATGAAEVLRSRRTNSPSDLHPRARNFCCVEDRGVSRSRHSLRERPEAYGEERSRAGFASHLGAGA